MAGSFREHATRGLNGVWYGGGAYLRLLWPIHILFRGLIGLRRILYARRLLASADVGAPIVVVGNLTAGGTGKTPLTVWLARRLTASGLAVGIVASGYGGEARQWPQLVDAAADPGLVGDEAVLLARRTGCRVAAGPDRVAAARALTAAGSCDVIVSDDGLQHYRLRRAIELVVIDGTRGLGNGLCLPVGPLREPASRLRAVDAVIVNDGDFGHRGVFRCRTRVLHLTELGSGRKLALADFAGRRVHAVAAIGNPQRFFDLLAAAGLDVEPHARPDHARLAGSDLQFADGAPVLITEKDAVKCGPLGITNVFVVEADVDFATGDEDRLFGIVLRMLEAGVENQ